MRELKLKNFNWVLVLAVLFGLAFWTWLIVKCIEMDILA